MLRKQDAYLIIKELQKNRVKFEKKILSINQRDWNIYHWFVYGLIQKSLVSELIDEKDSLILKKIDEIFNEKFSYEKKDFLNNTTLKTLEMLDHVHEVKSSDFYEQIQEILN